MAKQQGIALNAFSMESFGVPYGYSPCHYPSSAQVQLLMPS